MPVSFQKRQRKLIACLSGEIDHHSAAAIRREIDLKIRQDKPEVLHLDFSAVTFMDSSGVGLVMGRYRQVQPYGGILELGGMSPTVKRIMRLSGIESIATVVERKEKTV